MQKKIHEDEMVAAFARGGGNFSAPDTILINVTVAYHGPAPASEENTKSRGNEGGKTGPAGRALEHPCASEEIRET